MKKKKKLTKRQILDITMASIMAGGMFANQTLPLVSAIEGRNDEEIIKNTILGHYTDIGDATETTGPFGMNIVAYLDEGYKLRLDETGEILEDDPESPGDFYCYVEKNGTYTFTVLDPEGNPFGESYKVVINQINPDAIIFEKSYYQGNLYVDVENKLHRKYDVAIEYSETESGKRTPIDVQFNSGSYDIDYLSFSAKATKNGYYHITVSNEKGQTKTDTYVLSEVSENAPVISDVEVSEVTPFRQYAVQFNVADEDTLVQEITVQIKQGDRIVYSFTPDANPTKRFEGLSENGTYTIEATDELGHTTTEDFVVEGIDNENPSIRYQVGKSGSNYAPVDIYVDNEPQGYELHVIGPNISDEDISDDILDPTHKSFNAKTNGTYTVIAIDKAGNSSQEQIQVDSVVELPSDISFSYLVDNLEPTNKEVHVTITTVSGAEYATDVVLVNDEGVRCYMNGNVATVRESGQYFVQFTDSRSGGTFRTSEMHITNIDTEAPVISHKTISSSTVEQKVQLMILEDNLQSVEVRTGAGELVEPTDAAQYIYTFTENGNYFVSATDIFGQTGYDTIDVRGIDEGLPNEELELELVYTPSNQPFEVTVNVKNGKNYQIFVNGTLIGENSSVVYTISKNGKYTFKVVDGSSTVEKTIDVNSFEEIPDTITFDYDDTKTNQDVEVSFTIDNYERYNEITAMLDGEPLPVIGGNTVTVPHNGTLVVIAKDTTTNTQIEGQVVIENINKTPISMTIDYPKGTLPSFDMIFKFDDDREYTVTVDGIPATINDTGEISYRITENKMYDIHVEDDYGNAYDTQIQITNIQKDFMEVEGVDYLTAKTNQDIEVYVTARSSSEITKAIIENDETHEIINYKTVEDTDDKNEKVYMFKISQNGNYTITFQNSSDIVTTEALQITNINKEKPEINLSFSDISSDQEEVVVTVAVPNKENFTTYLNEVLQESNVLVRITKNGIYTIKVVDDYGNVAEESFEIKNIVNQNIYIKDITYSDIEKTNQDIEVNTVFETPNNVTINKVEVINTETQEAVEGSVIDNDTDTVKTVISENGTYTIKLTASNGKTASKDFSVTNIYKGPIQFNYENLTIGNVVEGETVQLKFMVKDFFEGNSYKFVYSKNNEMEGTEWADFGSINTADGELILDVTENGAYTVQVTDDYGNSYLETINVDNFIDDSIDVVVNYDMKKTNKDVEVSYTINTELDYTYKVLGPDGKELEHTDSTFMATESGVYTFVISYKINDEQKEFRKTVEITNINKILPEFDVNYLTDITSKNVAIGINITNKDRADCDIFVNGSKLADDSNIYMAASNGEYTIRVVDDYGNETSKTITIDNIVDSPLTLKTIVEEFDKTNQNVPITLEIWSEDNLDYTVEVTLPNGEKVVKENITSFEATESGEYLFLVRDTDGNEARASVIISNINKERPKINIKYDTDLDEPTNKPVVASITVPNKDKYSISMKDSKGNFLTPSFISTDARIKASMFTEDGMYDVEGFNAVVMYTFTHNDTYTVYVIDEYGNEQTETIKIENIYEDDIDMKVDVDLETHVKELPVKVTVSNRDEYTYTLTNVDTGETKEFTQEDREFVIKENGKYSIILKDVAGNEAKYEFEVKNIDNETPEMTVDYDKSFTNKDVEANYSIKDASKTETSIYYFDKKPFEDGTSVEDVMKYISDKDSSKIKFEEKMENGVINGKFTMTDSGYYLIVSHEELENNSYKLIHVDTINKEAPIIKLSADNTKWTNGNVKISIDVTNKDKDDYSIYINGDKIDNTMTAYQNGTYKFKVLDKFGNVSEKSISIKNIDKTGPTISVAYKDSYTNKDLVVNITALDSLSGLVSVKAVGKSGKEYKIEDNQIVLSKNDTVKITAVDKVGNKTVKTYKFDNIDKVAPKLSISYSDKKSSKNVKVKFNVEEENSYTVYVNGKKIKGTVFYASKNGKYSVIVRDAAGNKVEKTFNIQNIDKKGPKVSIKYDDTLTDKPIEVTYEVSDELGIASVTLDGKKVSGGKFTIKKNGIYTFRVTDKAGNVFSQTLNIKNIDTMPPEIKSVKAFTEKLKTYISIDAKDDASGVKSIKLNGLDVTKIKDKIRIYTDGLYIIEVTDNYNRKTQEAFTIEGVRMKKYLPVPVERKDTDDEKGAGLIPTGKEDAETEDKNDNKNNSSNKDNNQSKEDDDAKFTIGDDVVIFGTSIHVMKPQSIGYAATQQELAEWYKVQAPDGYSIDFNDENVKYSEVGDYKIKVTINAPNGTVLNHEVELIVSMDSQDNVLVIKDKEDDGLLSDIMNVITSNAFGFIAKAIGVVAGGCALIAGGYYAVNEAKKRQEANMANVLIVINKKPFTVERIKRTMNTNDLKNHLVKDILSEYFKNTKERVKITSIVPVDEEMFTASEQAIASSKDCSKIIYISYEIKRDLR